MKTIGIPRALFYYYHFPLWESFFTQLGFNVVLSRRTDKGIIDLGVKKAVDEVCYPVKIYYGHLASLIGEVDYIFVPRLISVEKDCYICPKFMGLPDMIKASFNNLPELLNTSFDLRRNPKNIYKAFHSLGKKLNIRSGIVEEAAKRALTVQQEFEKTLTKGFTPLELLEGEGKKSVSVTEGQIGIGLIGHGYNIFDPYASLNILGKLQKMGVRVFTPEMLSKKDIEKLITTQPKRMYWTLGKRIVAGSMYVKQNNRMDGLVFVTSFGCGPDSMLGELMERTISRDGDKSFLNITLDEHTGEAGLNTRIEAFIDMLKRRKVG